MIKQCVQCGRLFEASHGLRKYCKKCRDKYGNAPVKKKIAARSPLTDRLRYARKRAGLTQEAVAEKLYMSRTGYAHYEAGRCTPTIATLKQISEVFGCSVGWLMGQEGVENNSRRIEPSTGIEPSSSGAA